MDKGVVGYGLVKDDFTIEEHDLASFVYINDAVNYIEMRRGGEISDKKIKHVFHMMQQSVSNRDISNMDIQI